MKKVITFTLLISSLFLIFSCQKENNSRTSPELTQIFNEQEIKDIEMLVSYVEKELKAKTKTDDIDKAYQEFLGTYFENYFNDINETFTYEDIKNLYSTIDKNTFNTIWQYNKGFNFVLKDSTKSINMAYEKKYMKYLDVLGEKSLKIKGYVNSTRASGVTPIYSIPPLLFTFNTESRKPEIPKTFGDYNTRVYRSIDLITIADLVYHVKIEDVRIQKLKEQEQVKDTVQ
ncbi:hypothetical protein [Kordia sp.]|uniref:hypothetical protein n=1 Tax=Kordia sp. TaxID=1965332 RepID=UPI003D6A299A